MKVRRSNNSKSYTGRSLAAYGGQQEGGSGFGAAGGGGGRSRGGGGDGAGAALWSTRLRLLSFYLTVFISGCLLTGFLLSLSPQQQLERTSARVMLQHTGAGGRRGLYAGTGGE
jgi:hypothetical protein